MRCSGRMGQPSLSRQLAVCCWLEGRPLGAWAMFSVRCPPLQPSVCRHVPGSGGRRRRQRGLWKLAAHCLPCPRPALSRKGPVHDAAACAAAHRQMPQLPKKGGGRGQQAEAGWAVAVRGCFGRTCSQHRNHHARDSSSNHASRGRRGVLACGDVWFNGRWRMDRAWASAAHSYATLQGQEMLGP